MSESKNVFSNIIWRLLERCGAQIVTFVVSVVLARLLDPEVYGSIALVTVFTTILQVFVDSGLGTSLIQKKDSDSIDFSTVFFFNLIVCVLLYVILFFVSPLIASFYNNEGLTPVIRVMGLILIISGVKNIQIAYVSKKMIFKKFFFATLGGTIFAAVVGIYMAYKGYGVWALVVQNLANQFIDTVILWITVKWRPKFVFSFKRLKSLFSFGWKMLISSLLDTGYKELRALIIGKKYTSENLAFYNKGQQFPNLITQNINSSIDSVLLPTMAKAQNDKERVKAMTRKSIKISTYVMMPLMVGLAVCAEPIVKLLLTDKWLPCVPFLRIFCFVHAFYPIHTANLNAIKAMGRSDIFLGLEIAKKLLGITVILITMWFGIMWIAYSLIFTSIMGQIINSFPNKKLLGYSYIEQVGDMLPQIALSLVMGGVVYCLTFIQLSTILTLVLQVITGIIFYVVCSILFKFESFYYILDTIKGVFKKGKNREVSEIEEENKND